MRIRDRILGCVLRLIVAIFLKQGETIAVTLHHKDNNELTDTHTYTWRVLDA